MRYRLEIWLGPGSTIDHLSTLVDAALTMLPAAIRPPVEQARWESTGPGSWALICDPLPWSEIGTLLYAALQALERHGAGHEVWLQLGPIANRAGFSLSVEVAGDWKTIYRAG